MSTRTEQAAAQVLAASKAPETEVIVTESRSALTRFAGNTIHQNVAEENLSALVRVVWQKRIGVASGNDMSPSGLRRLARQALDIAKHQPAVPDFPGLASKEPIAQVEGFSGEVTSITPAKRASAAAKIIGPAARKGATASGVVSQETGLITVANSRGAGGTFRNSAFEASAVIEKGSGAGYAGAISWVPSRVDVARVGKVALKKAIASDDARSLAPDNYTVILEPQAVADLIAFMGYMGFGAQDFLEGTSFLSSRMGQKVMHESVSIWDDGLDPAGMPMPFDYEGVPKRRVSLIENGMARGVVYDTHYAAKAGARSTGHALPPTYGGGPLPTNLFMAPGTSSLDEMVASTGRGLLVTRFHYVNIADPANAVLTGLTRDGTFWIENGKIRYPVKNLRFTESMLSAFSAVEAMSRELSLEPAMLGGAVVPAVKIASFRFTGATEF